MITCSAIEYIHPKTGVKWVAAWDTLSEAIEWIRKYPAVEVTNMVVGDRYSVARTITLWKRRGAEEQAIEVPDTPTNVRQSQERRGVNLPERY